MFFKSRVLFSLILVFSLVLGVSAQVKQLPAPHEIGFSIGLNKITQKALEEAKAAGVDYIEISGLATFIDKNTNVITSTDKEIANKFKEIKAIADKAGIKIWSIHMPYGKDMDISLISEVKRKRVVQNHQNIIKHLGILAPQIVLFHPSWYLGINEREERKLQLIKSAKELQKSVEKIKATIVLENMLGPKLMANKDNERPLNRSVEEMVEIMNRLPLNIYAAVDMNHIKNPELLVKALGSRLKSVHIADGDGLREQHAFPCSGEGKNDWTKILGALYEVGYQGVFMYECKNSPVKELKTCYQTIYNNYTANK